MEEEASEVALDSVQDLGKGSGKGFLREPNGKN